MKRAASSAVADEIDSLRTQLREHNYRYYVLDEPSIPDATYVSRVCKPHLPYPAGRRRPAH